jgi:hypothetical protein
VERVFNAHRPLLKIEDFDAPWTSDGLFREAFAVQALPQVRHRDGIHEMSFPNLTARFETVFDADSGDPRTRHAIDGVM